MTRFIHSEAIRGTGARDRNSCEASNRQRIANTKGKRERGKNDTPPPPPPPPLPPMLVIAPSRAWRTRRTKQTERATICWCARFYAIDEKISPAFTATNYDYPVRCLSLALQWLEQDDSAKKHTQTPTPTGLAPAADRCFNHHSSQRSGSS